MGRMKTGPERRRGAEAPEAPAGVHEPGYFSAQVTSARRFYLRVHPAGPQGFSVAGGGVEHCRPDYVIDRAGFAHTVVEFVARGTGALTLGGVTHALYPGTVFTYGRNQPHRIASDGQVPLIKYFVIVGGAAFRSLLERCRLAPGTVARVHHPDQIRQVFDDLIRHGLGDHADRDLMCAMAGQYLIMKMGDLAVPEGEAESRAFATYQRCRQHIEDHYRATRSIKEVAAACHVDAAYLCRLFQRFGREQPARYLQHLRLGHAAELLHTTDLLVKEVAGRLGYSDPFNFSRAFRRAFGVPPKAGRAPRATVQARAGRPRDAGHCSK